MSKSIYTVPIQWTQTGLAVVEATSKSEAKRLALQGRFLDIVSEDSQDDYSLGDGPIEEVED